MLELNDIAAGYGNSSVIEQINLAVRPGELVALVGANGAGKSTLLKTISGLLPLNAGSISLDGVRTDHSSSRQRVLKGISHVPEGRQVFAGLTVQKNLELGFYTRRREGAAALRSRLEFVCEYFPVLAERLPELAGNFSGGQQQMLAIARGLMSSPKILLLDEPSLGLSPILVSQIFVLISRLKAEGIGVLLAEQNARMSLAIADHAYVIEMGHVVMEGTGKELLNRPDIAEKYLGISASGQEADSGHIESMSARLREILSAD